MEEFNKTIYKKDTKGKFRLLRVTTNNGELLQESGIIDGAITPHKSLSKGKNIGKANETTPAEQAVLEAASIIKKKLDKGYFETIEEAKNEVVIMPMLAHTFSDHKDKVEFPAFAQPKLDGMRCLAHIIIEPREVNLISRGGKNLNKNFPHIVNELSNIKFHKDLILDGELYAHGDDFQRNMELCKKYRPGETEAVKFNVYDIVWDKGYTWRHDIILEILQDNNFEHIHKVDTYEINNEEDLKEVHTQVVEEGYEGTMVRWGNAGYKPNGKSNNLLKYKDFIDIALPIKDVVPNEKNPLHGTPIFHWPGAKNDEFNAGTRLTHEMREDLLKNKAEYIGQTAELRFPEYYNTGVPRFPVMVGIRLDK